MNTVKPNPFVILLTFLAGIIVHLMFGNYFVSTLTMLLVLGIGHMYADHQEDMQEQRRMKLERWDREREQREREREQQRLVELERENQRLILELGVKRLPDGTFEVASPEEKAAARKAAEGS